MVRPRKAAIRDLVLLQVRRPYVARREEWTGPENDRLRQLRTEYYDHVILCLASKTTVHTTAWAYIRWLKFKELYERDGQTYSTREYQGNCIGEAAWLQVSSPNIFSALDLNPP